MAIQMKLTNRTTMQSKTAWAHKTCCSFFSFKVVPVLSVFLTFVISIIICLSHTQAQGTSQNTANEEGYIDATTAPLTTSIEEVISCPQGSDGEHSIRVLRRLSFYESAYMYYFQKDEEPPIPFGGFPGPSYKGSLRDKEREAERSWMQISCQKVPKANEHILIALIEPHTGRLMDPYVSRYNSKLQQWQSLSLPVEGEPLNVYINDTDLIFVGENPEQDREELDDVYISSQMIYGQGHFYKPLKNLDTLELYKKINFIPQIEVNDTDLPKRIDKAVSKK